MGRRGVTTPGPDDRSTILVVAHGGAALRSTLGVQSPVRLRARAREHARARARGRILRVGLANPPRVLGQTTRAARVS